MAKDGTALAYASVRFDNGTSGVLTNEEGLFDLPKGVKEVSIAYIGYEEQTVTKKKLKGKLVRMEVSDLSIEGVVVSNPDPAEIMRLADSLSVQNHFASGTSQNGFYKEELLADGQTFKVSEASFNRLMFRKDGKRRNGLNVHHARSVQDSATVKELNNLFNLKKDKIEFEIKSFIEIGQAVSFNQSTEPDGKSSKLDAQFEFNGYESYQGRDVYDIGFSAYKGKKKMIVGRYLVDMDTYAMAAFEMQLNQGENLNKLIPFAARAILKIMGYSFSINNLDYRVYFNPGETTWYMDKSAVTIDLSIAKKDQAFNGLIRQQYFMGAVSQNDTIPQDKLKMEDEVNTYDFGPDFWEGNYHIPTSSSTKGKVKSIEDGNSSFEGDVYSDRYVRWEEKQERKKQRKGE